MMRALSGMLGAGGMADLEKMAAQMQGQLPPGAADGESASLLGANPFAAGGPLDRKK